MSRGPNMKEKMKSKTEASVCSEVTMVPRVEGEDRGCGGGNFGELDDVSCICLFSHF